MSGGKHRITSLVSGKPGTQECAGRHQEGKVNPLLTGKSTVKQPVLQQTHKGEWSNGDTCKARDLKDLKVLRDDRFSLEDKSMKKHGK